MLFRSNDAYNAMICSRFGHELGRNKTYQLSILSTDKQDARDLHPSLAGKQLFNVNFTFEELMRRHYMSWTFQSMKITESLSYEKYMQTLPEESIPVVIIAKDGSLSFNIGEDFEAQEEETIVTYQPKAFKERRKIS